MCFFTLNISANYFHGKIYISEVKENYFIFYKGLNKYISYTKIDVKPGDILEIEATLNDFLGPSYSGDFSTLSFFRGQSIKNSYEIISYKPITSLFSFKRLRFYLEDFYKNKISNEYYELFCCLVLGDNILTDTASYANLNILHVLALSGFHLVLIYNVIFKMVFYLTKRYVLSENISIIFMFLYTLLCGFSISLVRALLYLVLKILRQRLQLFLTDLDLFSFTFLILMLKPLCIYNIGFIFSQLSSFIIIFLPEFVKVKNKILKEIISGILLLSFTFPFITNMTNSLSLFALVSFVFTNICSYIFIPLNFLFLILPKMSYYLEFLVIGFNNQLHLFSNVLVFNFPYMNNFFKIVYYILLFFILFNISKKRKIYKFVLSLSLFFFLYLQNPYFIKEEVIFLDVGQGDSCYIKASNSTYLIDCYNAYDYIRKRGIYQLDAIFISHSDSDHLGDLREICKNIKVETVYYSFYDDLTPQELEGINVRQVPLKFRDIIKLGSSVVEVKSNIECYVETNDNSLVLEVCLNSFKYLFCGDISIKVEEQILPYLEDVDVLKVAHHGSKTSSSDAFLAKIKPEISIISCGYKNKYGFPDIGVLAKLKAVSNVYLTYEKGNIRFLGKRVSTYKDVWYNTFGVNYGIT